MKKTFLLFSLIFLFINTAHADNKSWLASGIQISTHDPNILTLIVWCKEVNTDKKIKCIAPQRKGNGLLPGVNNRAEKISVRTKPLSHDVELSKIRYRMGDLRKLPTGKYRVDSITLVLGNPYDRRPQKDRKYDLSHFNIEFDVQSGLNYLGDLHIIFSVDNLYRLQPEIVVSVPTSNFAPTVIKKGLKKKYLNKQMNSSYKPVDISLKPNLEERFVKLEQWGKLPNEGFEPVCTGWRAGFKRAEINGDFLILDRGSAGLNFPQELWASSLGCVINKHIIENNYTEYRLSSEYKKTSEASVQIRVQFR